MRLVLCLLLTLAAAPAWAEWVEMHEDDAMTVYMDSATIFKNGNLRRAWDIMDFKQRDEITGKMSLRSLNEYDCEGRRSRTLAGSTHSGKMASGKIISIRPAGLEEWRYIAPGTIDERILKFVCAK